MLAAGAQECQNGINLFTLRPGQLVITGVIKSLNQFWSPHGIASRLASVSHADGFHDIENFIEHISLQTLREEQAQTAAYNNCWR